MMLMMVMAMVMVMAMMMTVMVYGVPTQGLARGHPADAESAREISPARPE